MQESGEGGEGDDEGRVDDRWRGVRQGLEIGGVAGHVGLGEGRCGDAEREREKGGESSHCVLGRESRD